MTTPKTKGLVKDQFLVSSSGDKTVKMWNVAGNECVREFLGHGGAVKALTVIPKDCVVSGSLDKTIKLWDVTGLLVKTITNAGDVSALATLTELKKLVTKDTIKV